MAALLEVKDLKVSFFIHAGEVQAVRGVSFTLDKGESLAIVGESGCGKSVTAQTIMRLIPTPPGRIMDGSVNFAGQDLVNQPEKGMQRVRGKDISMIFQDPMTSLNPTMTVGNQIAEVVRLHQKVDAAQARERALEMLRLVGLPNPERCYSQYPHEFSGGMRQRAIIAMALSCEPKLLIADEPTTALDVTIQAQILELMKSMQSRLDTAIILITHDLGIVAGLCHRVLVMYAGRVVESGKVEDIYYRPQHPYTWGLLKSVPRLDAESKRRLVPILGQPPDLIKPPAGCAFAPRCNHAMRVCLEHEPPAFPVEDGHQASCWLLHPHTAGVGAAAGLEVIS
ncbi:ABC transporter ATP-binding protein [Desulfallas sp. Bu1-1]|uniref:ABC transporter ATP-binding protein n=1 Tax=Desulfallas sp. Bu1-1 TaxID=2787620 RepID=UPI00189F3BFB|nr:ABC transporter ATP-binding protein [Desulfallas sp. Bu1-1]MBF7084018.1 ABC transporter ATP-binding protein [Desulfallas sp. Bu1-1]